MRNITGDFGDVCDYLCGTHKWNEITLNHVGIFGYISETGSTKRIGIIYGYLY